MTERPRRQISEQLSKLRKLGSVFFDTRTSHPLIDNLDVRPQRRLNPFLSVPPNEIDSLNSLNSTINGVGENIHMLIKAVGGEKEVGGKPAHALEISLEDGTISAYYGVVPGLISIHRTFLHDETFQSDYNVYIPIGEGRQLTSIHTATESKPRYYARDERNGLNFDPEHNSHDRRNIQGYLQLVQRATRDLLQATQLLAA